MEGIFSYLTVADISEQQRLLYFFPVIFQLPDDVTHKNT